MLCSQWAGEARRNLRRIRSFPGRTPDALIRLRAQAALLLLCYCAAYFGSAVHMAFVRHALCEHGQVVEVEQSFRIDCDHETRAGGSDPAVIAGSAAQHALEHEHEHCSIVAPFSRPASDLHQLRVVFPTTRRVAEEPAIVAARPARIPVYLLAPKHSPPSA